MRKITILAICGLLLGGVAGCRFLDCLRKGPNYTVRPSPAVVCPTPCPTYNPCDPCAGGATTTVVPGPNNYAPVNP
jgi:hypothetical protein